MCYRIHKANDLLNPIHVKMRRNFRLTRSFETLERKAYVIHSFGFSFESIISLCVRVYRIIVVRLI